MKRKKQTKHTKQRNEEAKKQTYRQHRQTITETNNQPTKQVNNEIKKESKGGQTSYGAR